MDTPKDTGHMSPSWTPDCTECGWPLLVSHRHIVLTDGVDRNLRVAIVSDVPSFDCPRCNLLMVSNHINDRLRVIAFGSSIPRSGMMEVPVYQWIEGELSEIRGKAI